MISQRALSYRMNQHLEIVCNHYASNSLLKLNQGIKHEKPFLRISVLILGIQF